MVHWESRRVVKETHVGAEQHGQPGGRQREGSGKGADGRRGRQRGGKRRVPRHYMNGRRRGEDRPMRARAGDDGWIREVASLSATRDKHTRGNDSDLAQRGRSHTRASTMGDYSWFSMASFLPTA